MRPLILILSALLMAGATFVSAQAGGDAGDLYFKGYLQFTEAERMEKAGDLQNAYQKLLQAQQNIGSVARTSPGWQPEIVGYRLKMIDQALQRLSGAAVIAVPSTPLPLPNTSSGTLLPNAQPPTGIVNPLDYINQQFQALQKQNAEMQSKLKLYEDGYTNALRDRQKSEQDRAILSQQLQDINQRIDKMAKDAAAKITGAEQQLQKLQNEYKMVADMMASRDRQLEDKDKTIASLENEKKALFVDSKSNAERMKQLENEVASLKANGNKPGDYGRILTENTRLKQELEVARQQVETLKTSGEKKDVEIATLKSQIAGIQTDLVKLRQENNVYQSQVADLTLKLKEMDATTPAGQAPKLAKDNAMLRNIIMRHLRMQERQRQAKELVIAEMKKMEHSSKQMMENLEEMTSAKIILTMDEEPLFTAPQLKEIIDANGVRATLMAVSGKTKDSRDKSIGTNNKDKDKGKPNSTTATAEEKILAEAIKAQQKGDMKAAEQLYQDALRANPKNTSVLLSLAALKQQQKKYDDAKVLLQKCLVYDPENHLALYRLGVCHFQQGNLPEAMTSLEQSLVKNGDNARAHHYLGIIANRMNNHQRAESEFKQALAIDPQDGDAHFNLAVLYATSNPPDWLAAKKHYKVALERGIKSDATLEKLLHKEDNTAEETPKVEKSTAAVP